MANKREIIYVIKYAKEKFGIECSWGRIGSLINRVGYAHVVKVLINLKPELIFRDSNHLLSYVQTIATELAAEEIEKEEKEYENKRDKND